MNVKNFAKILVLMLIGAALALVPEQYTPTQNFWVYVYFIGLFYIILIRATITLNLEQDSARRQKWNQNIAILFSVFAILFVITMFFASENHANAVYYQTPFYEWLNIPIHPFNLSMIYYYGASVLAILLAVKVIAPIYLKIVKRVRPHREMAYLDLQPSPTIDVADFFRRSTFSTLLLFGAIYTLFQMGIINPSFFLPPVVSGQISNLEYSRYVIYLLCPYIWPFIIAISAVAWTLEDNRIIFNQGTGKGNLSIEKMDYVASSYYNVIKGYGGLSAIFYYASAIYSEANSWYNFILLIAIFSLNLALSFPVYAFYWKLKKIQLRKGLPVFALTQEEWRSHLTPPTEKKEHLN
ncbi:MAG TPA: hypothetical protein VKK79_04155 [Candidatus Lokiarchaeia archaeon]|nr:hypothetical protein [Candidatus Lokiarchaeia archaeon]